MAKRISGSIASFANGVSQQASALRLASQGELQVNCYSTVIDGLRKRPPTQRRNILDGVIGDLGNRLFTHMIHRDTSERYEVFASKQGVRVFSLIDGTERDVTYPSGIGYLNYNGSGAPPYRAYTVGDYTFLTNRAKAVRLSTTDVEPASPSEAIVHVLAGNYGKDYKVILNGAVVGWYRTPDGTSAAQAPAVDTSFIARRLAFGHTVALSTTVNGKANGDWTWKSSDTNLNAKGINAANGWTVKVIKGTIYVRNVAGTSFKISVEDGYNGHAMKAIKGEVQDFADLPAFCEHGMAVKITGSVSTKFDDYFVRFDGANGVQGVWREIPQPGVRRAFDEDTMPHVLVRQSNGHFTFEPWDWQKRKAGDENTSPSPSFVGAAINDITFFKNRLVLLAGENVIMSRAGVFRDFWKASATVSLDDDPIDVAAAEGTVSTLRSAIGFQDRLLLFADNQQFSLRGGDLLTPKTVSITATTAYQATSTVRPVATSDVVFFAMNRGQFSMIREMRVNGETGEVTAEDITGHVPQYIPGTVLKMAASSHEDILLVQASGDAASLYIYKYYWAGNEKIQSSWSRWTFPGATRIVDFGFINSQMIVQIERSGQIQYEFMDVQPGGTDPNTTFICHLDQRIRLDPPGDWGYNDLRDETTIPVPINMVGKGFICVSAGERAPDINPGMQLHIVSMTPTQVVVRGDVSSTPVFFGTPYEMRYRLSTIYLRQESRGGGMSAVTEGRLQLLQLIFQYAKTAYFYVEATPLGGQVRRYVSNGRTMGDPENKVDRIHLGDGTLRIPVLAKNDRITLDIVNDSYLPCALIGAEWIANYIPKSQRV